MRVYLFEVCERSARLRVVGQFFRRIQHLYPAEQRRQGKDGSLHARGRAARAQCDLHIDGVFGITVTAQLLRLPGGKAALFQQSLIEADVADVDDEILQPDGAQAFDGECDE